MSGVRIAQEADALQMATLQAGLGGEPEALRALIDAITPIVQARVARALLRRSDRRGRDVRQEVEDLTQEVFVTLFADDAKALRAWDARLGLSLPNFVGLLAQRRVASIMRVRRRVQWGIEEPDDDPAALLPSPHPRAAPEASTASRELLERLLERLEAELSPRGLDLFQRLYVREDDVDEICEQTGLKPNAVHQWRRRLGQTARAMLEDLSQENPKPDRDPAGATGAASPRGRARHEHPT